jgi:hypothetical protein
VKQIRAVAAEQSVERTASELLSEFVSRAKDAMPYAVDWNSNAWDVSASDTTKRAHRDNAVSLFFTQHAGARVPLHQRIAFESAFGDLAKACVVHRRINRGVQGGVQRSFMRAIRYVYDACELPVRRDPTLLSHHHFLEAENAVQQREVGESAYRIGTMLEDFAKTIDRHGLTRAPLDVRCSIPKPRSVADKTSSTFEERIARLPAPAVLEALAEISNDARLLEQPFDLLRIRVVELLFAGGFRAGELLTVPKNTLVREMTLDESGGVRLDPATGVAAERIGLRYWPEKGGEPIIKWVPTVANALVVRAVADVDRLCKPARDNAEWLEKHAGDVRVSFSDDARLSFVDVAKTVGIVQTRQSVKQWLRQEKRRPFAILREDRGKKYVLGADLRCAIAADRYDAPVVTTSDGKQQPLSRSLMVIFMHSSTNAKPTNEFISEPLTYGQIRDFLCGRAGAPSIFERLDYKDAAGKPMRITTHDFRRVLNTIAQRGGLSQVEIARWMGRRRIGDNEAYDYRTPADIAAELRPLVERNEVFSEITKQVQALPQTERDAFLQSRLAMVHTTPYGQCGSSIAENPCETAVSCLGGCRHYLRRKGDTNSRARLQKIEAETLANLEKAREARDAGKYNARNWLRAQETVLQTVREALAIDDDPEIVHGEIVAVNSDGPSIGEPM